MQKRKFKKLYKLLGGYPTPLNITYFWNFGSLAGFFLLSQIVTGILLSFWYVPTVEGAFASVDFIMRDVKYGWLIRYLHANGASFFFLTVYMHMARALFFGSYTTPRQKVWYTGIVIFLLMIVTAFLGYVLPWGQMSYWAATVITSLVSTIPVVGNHLLIFLWGGIAIDQPTLTRVYGLHFLLPFVIFAFVLIHIYFLHEHGSNHPLGFEPLDYAPFHSYFILKDIHGVNLILILFFVFVFFYPNYLGHPDNYIPANPSVTPPHIVPEWYFLPFYGILRSVPNKAGGILLLIFALLVLTALPLIHRPLLRSSLFRPFYCICLYWFFAAWILLGWSGSKPIAYPYYEICQISTAYYFLFFLFITPLILVVEELCYESLD